MTQKFVKFVQVMPKSVTIGDNQNANKVCNLKKVCSSAPILNFSRRHQMVPLESSKFKTVDCNHQWLLMAVSVCILYSIEITPASLIQVRSLEYGWSC